MPTDEIRAKPTRTAVAAWMVQYITAALDIQPDDFSRTEHFDSYGLDSAELVIMAGIMEEQFGIEINPELFFEAPTVDGVLENLVAAGILLPD